MNERCSKCLALATVVCRCGAHLCSRHAAGSLTFCPGCWSPWIRKELTAA